jgi:hypothetical protein
VRFWCVYEIRWIYMSVQKSSLILWLIDDCDDNDDHNDGYDDLSSLRKGTRLENSSSRVGSRQRPRAWTNSGKLAFQHKIFVWPQSDYHSSWSTWQSCRSVWSFCMTKYDEDRYLQVCNAEGANFNTPEWPAALWSHGWPLGWSPRPNWGFS